LDIPRCVVNFERIINMLFFDVFTGFSNGWNYAGGCHTLDPLASWIPAENKTLCPAFSSEVRNTITPFITFFLGLVTMIFITRTRENLGGNS